MGESTMQISLSLLYFLLSTHHHCSNIHKNYSSLVGTNKCISMRTKKAPFHVCTQACSPNSLPTQKQYTGDKKRKLYSIKLHQKRENCTKVSSHWNYYGFQSNRNQNPIITGNNNTTSKHINLTLHWTGLLEFWYSMRLDYHTIQL